jgi:ERF superfamily
MDMLQRSSESIGCLAAALAKAQGELTNPEKSLVGTIPSDDPDEPERLFRYASLSSGLDIVRKVLGQHEIATVQTTAIDQAAGTVNLTTVLAHASGEWIAADWPVCAIAEMATPHRMGAALTYARRYALFTLVGIAGEDDLDAPDLLAPTGSDTRKEQGHKNANSNGRFNGSRRRSERAAFRWAQEAQQPKSEAALGPEASAELRDKFLVELSSLGSPYEAALWAKRSLTEKNKLTESDARQVEDAFEVRLIGLGTVAVSAAPSGQTVTPRTKLSKAAKAPLQSDLIDKSVLTFPEPRRIRDRDHLRFVAKQPCLVCGRQPSDAHHVRFAQSPALGRKVSDEFAVPLCRGHHREVHRCGDEPVWWLKVRINPMVKSRALWLKSHPLSKPHPSR